MKKLFSLLCVLALLGQLTVPVLAAEPAGELVPADSMAQTEGTPETPPADEDTPVDEAQQASDTPANEELAEGENEPVPEEDEPVLEEPVAFSVMAADTGAATAATAENLQAAINEAAVNGGVVTLQASLTLGAGQVLTIPAGGAVTLASGAGGPFTLLRGEDAAVVPLITVSAGATLTLENVILDGNAGGMTARNPLVRNSGSLTIGSGAVLQNNHAATSSSTFGGPMYYGGGLYNSGVAHLAGGSIINNFTQYDGGGGVYNTAQGQFTMSSGIISGNTDDSNNWGLTAGQGGGIYSEGTLLLSGGTIQP